MKKALEECRTVERVAILISSVSLLFSAIGYIWIVNELETQTDAHREALIEYEMLVGDSMHSLDEIDFHERTPRAAASEYLLYANFKQKSRKRYRKKNGYNDRPIHRPSLPDLGVEGNEFEEENDAEPTEEPTEDPTDLDERNENTETIRKIGQREKLRICDCSRIRCPRGPRGPPGDDGTQGTSGDSGVPGRPGIDGIFQQDFPCDPCPQGLKGPLGAQGEPGPEGKSGKIGRRGRDGVNEKGQPGEDGPRGRTGKRGKKGEVGETGQDAVHLIGVPGPKGRTGLRGFPGPRGDPGLNGRNAQPGKEGARGIQGEPGVRGEPGPRGPPGRQGTHGKDGGYCNCPSRNGDTPLGFNGDFDPSEFPEAGHYEKERGRQRERDRERDRNGAEERTREWERVDQRAPAIPDEAPGEAPSEAPSEAETPSRTHHPSPIHRPRPRPNLITAPPVTPAENNQEFTEDAFVSTAVEEDDNDQFSATNRPEISERRHRIPSTTEPYFVDGEKDDRTEHRTTEGYFVPTRPHKARASIRGRSGGEVEFDLR